MPFKLDGNVCYYNGEIYNFRSWDASAVSDGSVILAVYKEEGVGAFALFDAEFAISIWDDNEEAIILARDPFGTKPLYFSINGERLLWASSASAIHAMEPHLRCHPVTSPVSQHTTSVQEPYSSFAGIWALPPGHALIATRCGIHFRCFHHWLPAVPTGSNLDNVFEALEESLRRRLDYDGTLAVPMSGGIDSGIIAFIADRLNIRYHIFSVVEMFGHATEETETIHRRIERLRHVSEVTLLSCGEEEYGAALRDMYLPDYYDFETYDNGNILVHTLCSEVGRRGLRVMIDGAGGDELFHGYRFRDDFVPVPGWPRTWDSTPSYYSLYSTLLAWTAKTERAGGHFSIETRFPYQNLQLMMAATSLRITDSLKWPLRRFLLDQPNYGRPTQLDINGKYGFSIKHRDLNLVLEDLRVAWRTQNDVETEMLVRPIVFPFQIGCDVECNLDELRRKSTVSLGC
jgi:asparagine synthetase B (glutamine-hydrolysing)